jgi:transcriptional regulator with XRE-family HTH domain
MEIGSRIRAARKTAGLSQEELARRAGMSLKGMSYIERGHIEDPHYSSLSKIADALGVSVGELLEDPHVPKAPAPTSPQLGAEEPGEERRIFDVVRELVTRQLEEDRQAIARAGESELAQGSTVRHENEARDRLLQYHPADVAEAYVDLMRRFVYMEQQLENIQAEATRPEQPAQIREFMDSIFGSHLKQLAESTENQRTDLTEKRGADQQSGSVETGNQR